MLLSWRPQVTHSAYLLRPENDVSQSHFLRALWNIWGRNPLWARIWIGWGSYRIDEAESRGLCDPRPHQWVYWEEVQHLHAAEERGFHRCCTNFLSRFVSYLTLTQDTRNQSTPVSSKRRYDGVRYIGVELALNWSVPVTQRYTCSIQMLQGDYLHR